MKFKPLLILAFLTFAIGGLAVWHKNYKPNILKIDNPIELIPLGQVPVILEASTEKDKGMLDGLALERSKDRNIFTPDGKEIIVASLPGANGKPLAPPEYPGRLVAISQFGTKLGALIECKNALPKPEVPGDKRLPKPSIGSAPAKHDPQNRKTKTVAYSSPLKGPGYYLEGDTLIDGAILKKVNVDSKTVQIAYSDSEYTLMLKYDWEALNKSMEEFRNEENKKNADFIAQRERAADEAAREKRRQEMLSRMSPAERQVMEERQRAWRAERERRTRDGAPQGRPTEIIRRRGM